MMIGCLIFVNRYKEAISLFDEKLFKQCFLTVDDI